MVLKATWLDPIADMSLWLDRRSEVIHSTR